MAAMVTGGGFAALAMLDEEDERGPKGKGRGKSAPAAGSALQVGEPQLDRDNAAAPWSVLVSGQSGVPVAFSLSFLKDFKKVKCPRGKTPTLKSSEKELVIEKFKKARKEAKKERTKQQLPPPPPPPPQQQQTPPQQQPAKPPPGAASAPKTATAPIHAAALEAKMMAASTPAPAPAPSAPAEDEEDYQQMLMMIRESTGLNLTFVAGGSSVVSVTEPPANAWAQGAPPVADLNWQQQQQQEWQPAATTSHTYWDDAPVVGPDDYIDEFDEARDGPVVDEWQAVGKTPADGSSAGGKKNKKKKKKKNNAGNKTVTPSNQHAGGNFAALGALAAGDDSDDDASAPTRPSSSASGLGLSVSQLSVPRKDKANADCPWVVDLTLASGQVLTIGLDFLKSARLDDLKAGNLDLKYAEKDRALHKYKEQRKLEKKQRAKEAKEQSKAREAEESAALPGPDSNSAMVTANHPPSEGALVRQKPVLTRLSGLTEPEEGEFEVLPGISFTPPAVAAGAPAADNRMTWRRQLPDGRVQTITTTTTQADAQNWMSTIAQLQQKPAPASTRTDTGLTPRKSSSWAIRVRWADGSSCTETDQYNAPAAFVAFGPIKSAVFKPGKRHGWIDYVDESAAFVGRVCAQMDGQMVCGRRVRVEPVENETGKQQWTMGNGQPRDYQPNARPTPTQPEVTQQQIVAAQAHQEKMRSTDADAGTTDGQGAADAAAEGGGEAL